jgi:hypothetical protein
VQLARDRLDAGAGFRGDEGAAVERRAAPDQLLPRADRRRSTDEFHGAVDGPREPRGPCVSQHEWICHSLYSFESAGIQLRPVTYRKRDDDARAQQ